MERLMIEKAEISCKLAEYENGKLWIRTNK
jgi:hypothetical protein